MGKTNKLLAVAYHEAGHAVVSWQLGVPLRRTGVTIIPHGSTAGATHHWQVVGRDVEWDLSDRNRLRTEKLVQICLAGNVAQRRFDPRSVRGVHADSDHQQAVDALIRWSTPRELEVWVKLLYLRTEQLLANANAWRAVERLAEALVQQGRIRGKEATEIIRVGFDEQLNETLAARSIGQF